MSTATGSITTRENSLLRKKYDYASRIVLNDGRQVGGPLLIWYSADGGAQSFERDGAVWPVTSVEFYEPDPNLGAVNG